MQNITIIGVEGRALPLVHIPFSPMPTTEPGKEYRVPRDSYYVRAWQDGDCECPELDEEHGIKPSKKAAKSAATNAPKQGGK